MSQSNVRTITATVVDNGFGVASRALRPVMHLIEQRTGLAPLVPGTLNVRIPEDYIVMPDATITPEEYGQQETIKLQRCLVNGYQGLIMRPDTHETRPNWGHGKNHLELMGCVHFRDTLCLHDGDEVEVELEGDAEWWESGL